MKKNYQSSSSLFFADYSLKEPWFCKGKLLLICSSSAFKKGIGSWVFLFFFLPFFCQAQAPDFAWAKQSMGNYPEVGEGGSDIAFDILGNSYVLGRFEGSITIGNTSLIGTGSNGDPNFFIAKYDATGNVVWAKKVQEVVTSIPTSIAVDGNGNSYITGIFNGSTTFGSITLTSSGDRDIFITKYDAFGNVIWAKQAGGTDLDYASSIAVDGNGNSYITGGFYSSTTFGNTILNSSGSADIYIAKYDPSGNVLWAKQAGGTDEEAGIGLAIDGSGNSYITGGFHGSITFGITTLSSSGEGDVFIAKYDASGNVIWATKGGGANYDFALSIAVDGNGNSYITGGFYNSTTFGNITLPGTTQSDEGVLDAFIAKYDVSGNVLWAKKAGGTGDVRSSSIVVDGSGNSHITGSFWGNATFGSTSLTGFSQFDQDFEDVFIAKYDALGNVLWARIAGGTDKDGVSSIAVDGGGNSCITGSFRGSAIFGSITLTSSGGEDAFIVKYNASGNVLWATNPIGNPVGNPVSFTGNVIGQDVVVDAAGNSYTTGGFEGSAKFGNFTLISSGLSDVFIVKYDASGNVLWAKQAGGTGDDNANGMAIDGSGNIYITGSFNRSATFGSLTLTVSGDQDIFIAKYDASGNVVWAKQAGGSGSEIPNNIAVDYSGNSYITGSFGNGAIFGNTTFTGNASFIAKYNASGNVLWAKIMGGVIAVDSSGNFYRTGNFWGSITLGSITLTGSGSQDIFIAKYDASGNVLWAKIAGGQQVGGTNDINKNGLGVDGSGNIYITGYFWSGIRFGSNTLISRGDRDVFTAKYDASGNLLWAKQAGGSGFDESSSIAADGNGNSYITGRFVGSTTIGSTTLTSTASTNVDGFIAKYDASGTVLWAKQVTGTGFNRIYCIAVDGGGHSYITGIFQGSASFDNVTLTGNGTEAFIAKINADQYTLTTSVTGSGSVLKSPDQATYTDGSNVILTATPASGFQFSGWSGDASGTANPLTVVMNKNKNITATFTTVPGVTHFNLINATTDQSIQQLVSGVVLNLATLPSRRLNIRAVTNPATVGSVGFNLSGQQSKSRSDDSGPHYSLQGDNSGDYFSWTPPVGSYTLTARTYTGSNRSGTASAPTNITFTVIDQPNVVQYSLNVTTSGSGSVNKNPDQTSYNSGSTVTLTAVPAAGYVFSGWSGDASGTSNPLTVTINSNKNITATFVPSSVQYTLNVTVNGSGSVSQSPSLTTYLIGSSVSLNAIPASGYQFSGWSGDASGTNNPLTIVMNSNKNIAATFTAVPSTGVTSFNLINATSNLPIQQLVSGAVLNLATLPTRNLNIQTVTNPSVVGSVGFNLSGQQSKSRSDDSGPHYSLQGDNSGDYFNWTPAVGSYTLTARTYTGSNRSGTASAPNTITFTVIDQANVRTASSDSEMVGVEDVKVSPNPFKDALTLQLPAGIKAENATVTLTTLVGKTVYQKEIKVDSENGNQEEFKDLSNLSSGMYLLKLQLDSKLVVLKVMKM